MAIVAPGEKLPSVFLDRFQPAENVTYRLSVLDVRAIAIESHFVDIPSKQIKGVYQCIQGVCCQAAGRRRQTYNVLVYVYRDPTRSTEGDIQVWQLTAPQWKKFSDIAVQLNLQEYDLTLTASKRGYGMDLSYSAVPDVRMRQYWSPAQHEQLRLAVDSFLTSGEGSLVHPMTLNDWQQLLYDCGYDLQNQMWPGGQNPMNPISAKNAIGRAVLPPAPSVGGIPPGFSPVASRSVQQASQFGFPQQPQGQVGGVLFQPQPVQAGVVPQSVQASIPVGVPAFPQAAPVQSAGFQISPASNIPAQRAVPPPSGVPLGTAPVMPTSSVAMPAVGGVQSVSSVSNVQNEVPGTEEISAEELNKMLEG